MSISNKDLSKRWEPMRNPIVETETPHADARGSIIPLADEDMKSAVLITSKKGTVRANHYHHTDWHYCYVLKGKIDYYWREANTKSQPERVTIGQGQLFFTPPMVEHAMHFLEDTEFLCLGRNSREQSSYEADITRVELFKA